MKKRRTYNEQEMKALFPELNPHRVTNDFWWYEEKKGICICTEAFNEIGETKVSLHYITWQAIQAALRRKDKKG